jgi:hypothetical protein
MNLKKERMLGIDDSKTYGRNCCKNLSRSWNPYYTLVETARKFEICEGYVKQIKSGRAYSNVTGHKKGVIPSFTSKQQKKTEARDEYGTKENSTVEKPRGCTSH